MIRLFTFFCWFFMAAPVFAGDWVFTVGPDTEDVTASGKITDEPEAIKIGSGIENKRVEKLLAKNVELNKPDKWQGYLEFLGKPGTARSLGQSDLLVPLWQDKNDLTFFNLRGQIDDSDNNEFNVGIGHRQMLDEWIVGGYAYFDRRYSDETSEKYNQFTLGLEALSESFDFRVNGYIPEDNETEEYNQINSSEFNYNEDGSDVRIDYSQTDEWTFEKSLHGFDSEIGYKLPLSSLLLEDTRLYLGGYHFIGSDGYDSVSGPRVRLETRIHDLPVLGVGSRLMLGVESQWDDPRGSQTFGLVSLRIPFGVVSKKKRTPLKGLERRMMEPVVRDIDIVTSQKTTTETFQGRADALNIEGEAYTKVMEFTTDTHIDEIGYAVEDAVDTDGETPLVIIKGVGDNKIDPGTRISLWGGATYTMAGQSLNIKYQNSFQNNNLVNHSFTPKGETPEVFGTIRLDESTHLNGWNINAEGEDNGIVIDGEGDYFITNAKVSKATENGINIKGQSNVTIEDSKFTGNVEFGLLATDVQGDGFISIKGSEFTGNGWGGVRFQDSNAHIIDSEFTDNGLYPDHYWGGEGVTLMDGSEVTIEDSNLSDNAINGLWVQNDSVAIVKNTTIKGNGRDGVLALNNARIDIEDSEITGNGVSLIWLEHSTTVTITNSTLGGDCLLDESFSGIFTIDGVEITKSSPCP